MPDLSGTMRKCRIGTAKNFTLLLLLYITQPKALGMCENTVSKYVRSLEEKDLIRTEPTMIRSKEGRSLNGNLL